MSHLMMKEVVVLPTRPLVTTQTHDVPVPRPAKDQVLIRVVVAASNPKGEALDRQLGHHCLEEPLLNKDPISDYKHVLHTGTPINSGDDAAGIIEDLGHDVQLSGQFRRGDRVAIFHAMMTPGGTYAEYALAPATTVLLLPEWIRFESASTIPLTTLAAALPLFRRQNLPAPWMKRSPNADPLPLIVYGASSALGSFAIKLARHANIHPIIAIAGASSHYIKQFLDYSQGDTLLDYRNGMDVLKSDVKVALNGLQAFHALDAISEAKSWVHVAQMLSGGVVSVVQGSEKYDEPEIPANVVISYSFVGSAHSGRFLSSMPKQPSDTLSVGADVDFSYVLFKYISRMLSDREFEGHPFEVIAGGFAGIEPGLQKLQRGEAKALKYVYRLLDVNP